MGEGDETGATQRIPRLRRWAAIVALAVLVSLIALWFARKPIATRYLDETLAAAKVPARYGIADLGLGRQRLTNVVLGDPAHPDLVADWIETRTSIGLSGARVLGLRAGHVRMRGTLVDGTLSLGSIDRLLPASSGKPFALPRIDLDIADGRMRLETAQGVVGLKLSGSGRLDDGFAGRLAAISDRLVVGQCAIDRPVAALAVRIAKARPSITGPIRAGTIACGATRVNGLATDIDATLGEALDRWQGRAGLSVATVIHPAATLGEVRGSVRFDGTAKATTGTIDLRGDNMVTRAGSARAVAVAGKYEVGSALVFTGHARAGGAAVSPAMLVKAAGWSGGAGGTPVAPLAHRLVEAIRLAGREFAIDADLAVSKAGAVVSRAALASTSGARVALGGGSGVSLAWTSKRHFPAFAGEGLRLDTVVATQGGNLPTARMTLAQAASGAPVTGVAILRQPYAAGGASLMATPIRFSASPRGNTRFATTITLSGPLAGGRIDGLSLPVEGLWNGRDRIVVNPDCGILAFDYLTLSGLDLRRARLALCPVDGALFSVAGGRIGGGARIAAPRLAGTLGGTPITLAATDATLRTGAARFMVDGLAARLGRPDRLTRLDVATIEGRMEKAGLTGKFSGGAGQIGAVPLLMTKAAGGWAYNSAGLAVTGDLIVADAAADPRFKPLAANSVTLGLARGEIGATGTLATPDTGRKVAEVTIAHVLASGIGHADLVVPGITFGEDFQPDRLTRLTFGVIADVNGTVNGKGHIAWTPAGVTSDGMFSTTNTDLAAAFGPVTGISGTIRFTDLLSLESAPGQRATIKTINPGIPVNDGTITYQTYAGARVLVNGGRWPFAGGTLTLDPTLLDFSAPAARRMTFRVDGMAADKFLQQFDFKNLNATGTFDGVLPMIFDTAGGRIENGHLVVREGGGTIAYVGEISQKDVGVWGNLAFQALKSLRYRSLDIVMNGSLAGEMITEVRFAGISQGEGAKSNFLIRRLQKLPFVFNVKIKAPFRGLLDTAQSFYDPRRLIERNLPALLEQQNKTIQPPASRIVP